MGKQTVDVAPDACRGGSIEAVGVEKGVFGLCRSEFHERALLPREIEEITWSDHSAKVHIPYPPINQVKLRRVFELLDMFEAGHFAPFRFFWPSNCEKLSKIIYNERGTAKGVNKKRNSTIEGLALPNNQKVGCFASPVINGTYSHRNPLSYLLKETWSLDLPGIEWKLRSSRLKLISFLSNNQRSQANEQGNDEHFSVKIKQLEWF